MMGHLLMLVMLPMARQMKNESLERQLYLTQAASCLRLKKIAP